MKTRFATALFAFHALAASLVCVDATAAPAPIDDGARDGAFHDALALYRECHWSAAYGRFAALADQGHAEAARIALLMVRYGARLYGSDWGASQPQIDRWTELAAHGVEALKSESGD